MLPKSEASGSVSGEGGLMGGTRGGELCERGLMGGEQVALVAQLARK